MSIPALEAAATTATNRFMAQAYRQLAAAKTELALGNTARAQAHYARAKAAYAAAGSSEHVQVADAMVKDAQNRADGIARNVVTARDYQGTQLHVSMRDQIDAHGKTRAVAAYTSTAGAWGSVQATR
jgi:hypothetical protein